MDDETRRNALAGAMLGTAVGDAMGLPYEGLSRRRQRRIAPELRGYRFFLGKGFTSDDTEHTWLLAQALVAGGGDVERSLRRFAWKLRFWLLGLPAGVGFATLRAILKLWLGFPPRASGVRSAGNGPAMRVALLGIGFGDHPARLRAHVEAFTRITHTDERATHGALAVAIAAHLSAQRSAPLSAEGYAAALTEQLGGAADEELMGSIRAMVQSLSDDESSYEFAERLGCANGVSGYIYRTVPIALHVWLRHCEDYAGAIRSVIALGGDTDTAAAIVGALVGARVGKAGIPAAWLDGLWEWPRTAARMEALALELARVCEGTAPGRPVRIPLAGLVARNVLFLAVVLLHGFRRLLPPY